MAAYRYRLIDEDGTDLGPLASPRNDWSAGDRVARRRNEDLTIVSVVPAEDHDYFHAYLVVRPR